MKLILKRLPPPAISIGDHRHVSNHRPSDRPFALYTEDGEILPRQQSVVVKSLPGECPTVTVTLFLDGEDVKVVGDD